MTKLDEAIEAAAIRADERERLAKIAEEHMWAFNRSPLLVIAEFIRSQGEDE